MGSALLKKWVTVDHPGTGAFDFVVIDPAVGDGVDDPIDGVTYLAAPPPVDESEFDLLIVAVKPQVVDKVLPDYVERLGNDGFIASVAAGCSISRLSSLINGAPVVRIMPNLPVAIGQGVSGLCANDDASREQRDVIERLMQAAGTAIWVEDEDKLDRLTAVAGSGPGYIFEIARSYCEAAMSLGFTEEEARELVLGTMGGTIAMAQDSNDSLAQLRTNVTSKNGTTAAGLDALNGDDGLSERLKATVDAAYKRAIELR